MQQLLDKWERLRRSEYLRPDEKLMLNHCISDLKRFMDDGVVEKSDKQQTAVQWFAFELSKYGLLPHGIPDVIYKKAKEMEKEQIVNAFEQGENNSVDYFNPENRIKESEQYYNETYGGNK